MKFEDILLNRLLAPYDKIRILIELGYASKCKDERKIAGEVDDWLARQGGAVGYLRRSMMKELTQE
jgi:hypothetical protein